MRTYVYICMDIKTARLNKETSKALNIIKLEEDFKSIDELINVLIKEHKRRI